MKSPIRWMAQNHVAANLLMMLFIGGGLLMGFSIKQEVFPEVNLDALQVTVAYPGASPEEVEEGVILKIEEGVSGINGIKEIDSLAAEGVGIVTAEVLSDEDIDRVIQDIKAEIDRIATFPDEAEKPVITKMVNRREVISLVVYGNISERSLREHAENIRDDLLAMPGITQASLNGVRPYEISIEVPEVNLRRYNLTLGRIAATVRQASVDLPAGAVKSEGGEVLIRTKERRYRGFEYAGITIVENPDGTEVKLGEIAEVKDSFQESDQYATFDGLPAAMVAVFRVGDQRPTEISRVVKEYALARNSSLPDSVKLAVWNDRSEILKSRMNLLLKNAFLGLILVFMVLGLFLQIRLALWVMLGIPISFLGAMLFMPAMDISINMISLFAFILALGIVVDDAIVVGENVYTHRRMGKSYRKASIDGATEVSTPVVFSILTTVAAFLPLIFVVGMMGKFMSNIPLVVIPILAVSLIESLFVLPAHLALGRPVKEPHGFFGLVMRLQKGFSMLLEKFIKGPYRYFLTLCLEYRYVTLAAAIAVLFISAGIVGGGIVKFRFMPHVDGNLIRATLRMPLGTPVEETEKAQKRIVEKAMEVVARYDSERPAGDSVLRNIFSVVGGTVRRGGPASAGQTGSGSHLSSIIMFLTKSEQREIAASEIAGRWRKLVGSLPGAESLTFYSGITGFGANVDIRLAHNSFDVLTRAAGRIKKALLQYPGVSDIADNYSHGKQEIKLHLTRKGRTHGLTEEELGRQVRAAFYGAEALRLQRGRNELKVMVRYPEEDRKSIRDLESMFIRTGDGGEIPFLQAASMEEGRGFSEINRSERKRVINVTADVNSKVANAEEILMDLQDGLLEELSSDYPGLTFDLVGEEKERRESMGSLRKGFLVTLFLIYALLAIPFRSYSQPLIIMASIPFGVVGALLGHLIMGFDLSILSMFGIVALTGVVVNDSLLLIDYINRKRKTGTAVAGAIVESGERRFRPVILTSLTTSLGLTPIIAETSVQAQFLIPMAISLGFGILFATVITLLIIPSLYLILEDIKRLPAMKPDKGQVTNNL